jgi:hypothetical protein
MAKQESDDLVAAHGLAIDDVLTIHGSFCIRFVFAAGYEAEIPVVQFGYIDETAY